MSVIDTATNTVVATVTVGGYPSNVAISPEGNEAYVTAVAAKRVFVIDTTTHAVRGIRVSPDPSDVAFTPDGNFAYITSFESRNVSVIDTAARAVVATIAIEGYAYAVAISPDGTLAYVANGKYGEVVVINTSTNTIIERVYLGTNPYGYQAYPVDVAISPGGSQVFVTANNSYLYVMDTSDNSVAPPITFAGGAYAVAVAPGPDDCSTAVATIVGTPDADTLTGTPGADVIFGLGGDDTISGAGGDDLLCGGEGDDTLNGRTGSDDLVGGAGNDVCVGGADTDTTPPPPARRSRTCPDRPINARAAWPGGRGDPDAWAAAEEASEGNATYGRVALVEVAARHSGPHRIQELTEPPPGQAAGTPSFTVHADVERAEALLARGAAGRPAHAQALCEQAAQWPSAWDARVPGRIDAGRAKIDDGDGVARPGRGRSALRCAGRQGPGQMRPGRRRDYRGVYDAGWLASAGSHEADHTELVVRHPGVGLDEAEVHVAPGLVELHVGRLHLAREGEREPGEPADEAVVVGVGGGDRLLYGGVLVLRRQLQHDDLMRLVADVGELVVPAVLGDAPGDPPVPVVEGLDVVVVSRRGTSARRNHQSSKSKSRRRQHDLPHRTSSQHVHDHPSSVDPNPSRHVLAPAVGVRRIS
ncbi:hypothetical protein BH18ACT4_BH18ACT4_02720 [soil metagenome]